MAQFVGADGIRSTGLDVLQVNMGYRCNLSCRHCHLDAGPTRTEMMSAETVDAVLGVLDGHRNLTLDITGGSPEMNPELKRLIIGARAIGTPVMLRTNLTIFDEPGYDDMPKFYRDNNVELIASLPYYMDESVDLVRGNGAYSGSIKAIQTLNSLGYGRGAELRLALVYNPVDASLPPSQESLEREYRTHLKQRFDIDFNDLYAFVNMPAGRFGESLRNSGQFDGYIKKLGAAFNPEALDRVMCRSLLSVSPDGNLYDCDFNQALELSLSPKEELPQNIEEFDYDKLTKRQIAVSDHCYGCTAGAGSS